MTGHLRKGLCVALVTACAAMAAAADGDTHSEMRAQVDQPGYIEVDAAASRIEDFGADLHVELALSRSVVWQAYTLDAPRRLVLDFADADLSETGLSEILATDHVSALRGAPGASGGSRLVLELSAPFAIETAGLAPIRGGAVLKLQLAPTSARRFAAAAGAPDGVALREAATRPGEARRALRVALDPGPAYAPADEDGEGDLTLAFLRTLDRELSEAGIEVIRTYRGTGYVAPKRRLRLARAAEADLLVSLSPPAEGQAAGARVYTRATSSARPAFGGWRGGGARPVAAALELAWPETRPRSARLADHLARGLSRTLDAPPALPRHHAGLPMLSAPDIPSVLIGLGSRAAPGDLANLADPGWRRAAASGIRHAIEAWAREGGDEATVRYP